MNVRKLSTWFGIAAILSVVSPASAAETKEVDVLQFLSATTYLEIYSSEAVCTANSISDFWGRRPRIEFADAPWRAQSVQALATAAMLSDRKLTIRADTIGTGSSAKCYISYVAIAK